MTRSRFHACQEITARWEGGWSDHPDDPGGKTMYGLTEAVWRAYLRRYGKPFRPVKTATKAEVEELFRKQYWEPVKGDDLPPGLDLVTYDFAINSGPSRAIRHLQAALGVRQDGEMGQVTLAAAREAWERDSDGDVIRRVMASRERFLRGLSTFRSFGKGWMNRLRDVGLRAARMEEIEDKALTFASAGKRRRPDATPLAEPEIYAPGSVAEPVEPLTPEPASQSPAQWLASLPLVGGFVASVGAAVSNPWALAAVGLIAVAAGVGVWAYATGRLAFTRPGAA